MASSVLKQPQVKTMTKSYPAEYTIAGAGYYSIDNGADLSGKTIIGIVVTTWTSNTGAFSLIMGGGNAVYLVGTPNVKVKGLTVRYAYI